MKLDDEVYDECIEKIRKTMNFYGYQNREMADDILSDVSMPISRPLQETIRTQQATIERLTEQLDRLLGCIKAQNEREKEYLAVMHKLPRNYYFTNQSDALIAEIEAEK